MARAKSYSLVIILLIVISFMVNGCSIDIPDSENPDTKLSDNNSYSELDLSSIISTDLLMENEGLNIENTAPWIMFEVEQIGAQTFDYNENEMNEEDSVLKVMNVDIENAVPGIGLPALRIGEKAWSNYSFSFDFFMGDADSISFAMYDETNSVEASEFLGGNQNFWFTLYNNGRLSFDTNFGHGSYMIAQMDDFNPSVWNYIELIPVGLELTIKINSVDIGKVAELQENNSGRVAIGGAVGCMFDNLRIESLD